MNTELTTSMQLCSCSFFYVVFSSARWITETLHPSAASPAPSSQPISTHCSPTVSPSSGFCAHPFRPTATGPPGLQGTRKSPGRDCPEAEVYISHSSSYSSSTDSNRSSSQSPGHKRQTEPASRQRPVFIIGGCSEECEQKQRLDASGAAVTFAHQLDSTK